MKKFKVEIHISEDYEIELEADSEYEARRMADELFCETKEHFECLNTHFASAAHELDS